MRITDELGHAFDQDDVRILLSRSAHAAAAARSLPADRLVLRLTVSQRRRTVSVLCEAVYPSLLCRSGALEA